MSSSGTTTTTPTAASIFGALLQTIKSDVIADIKQPLLNAATAIKNNPTQAELIAQGIAVQGALIGALPVAETQGIAAGADTLIKLINLIPSP